jgi:hypothetical protein
MWRVLWIAIVTIAVCYVSVCLLMIITEWGSRERSMRVRTAMSLFRFSIELEAVREVGSWEDAFPALIKRMGLVEKTSDGVPYYIQTRPDNFEGVMLGVVFFSPLSEKDGSFDFRCFALREGKPYACFIDSGDPKVSWHASNPKNALPDILNSALDMSKAVQWRTLML